MNQNLKITCFGEVLWDVFEDEERIGGAPLNVAIRLNSFGVEANIISCVATDRRGTKIIDYLSGIGIHTSNIYVDSKYLTAFEQESLTRFTTAPYNIKYPVACDKIPLTSNMMDTVKECDALIYGSVACRDSRSRATLLALISHAKYKVLDVNLRQNFYDKDFLMTLIQGADFIKFN